MKTFRVGDCVVAPELARKGPWRSKGSEKNYRGRGVVTQVVDSTLLRVKFVKAGYEGLVHVGYLVNLGKGGLGQ